MEGFLFCIKNGTTIFEHAVQYGHDALGSEIYGEDGNENYKYYLNNPISNTFCDDFRHIVTIGLY